MAPRLDSRHRSRPGCTSRELCGIALHLLTPSARAAFHGALHVCQPRTVTRLPFSVWTHLYARPRLPGWRSCAAAQLSDRVSLAGPQDKEAKDKSAPIRIVYYKWLELVAVHSDAWLMAVAYFYAAKAEKPDRCATCCTR